MLEFLSCMHLDQKAMKCMTCKQLYGISFSSLFADNDWNLLEQLQNLFSGKIPRGEWVKQP